MDPLRLVIKNMVCDRCIAAVRTLLRDLAIDAEAVTLGEVLLRRPLDGRQRTALIRGLEAQGFALLDDPRQQTVEAIRRAVIEWVHYDRGDRRYNFSDYLSRTLRHDYNALSALFSEVEGTTVEKYLIAQRIERVKELLGYDELTLGEIALRLGYSSTAHLSAQFKRVVGITPSRYRAAHVADRRPLDAV